MISHNFLDYQTDTSESQTSDATSDSDYIPEEEEEYSGNSEVDEHVAMEEIIEESERPDPEIFADDPPMIGWRELESPPLMVEKVPSLPSLTIEQDRFSPIELLGLIIKPDFWETIAYHTNQYAKKKQEENALKPKSRMHQWRDVTKEEIMRFIGLILNMSLVKKPKIENYWDSSPLFTSHFGDVMSVFRFQMIMNCFQINSTTSMDSPKWEKISMLMKTFQKFKELYRPSSKISLDETISAFNGRFKFKQYNKGKPHKWGMRLITVADALTSYCIDIVPCFGQETYQRYGAKTFDDLILSIVDENKLEGSDLYMDNYYTHPTLANKLMERHMNLTGTFRKNRTDVPGIIKDAKVFKKITVVKKSKKEAKDEERKEIHESDESAEEGKVKKKRKCDKSQEPKKEVRYFQNDKVLAVKWRHKREVLMLSTIHGIQMEETESTRKLKISRPRAINEYNRYMRGVDVLNQRTRYIK